MLFLSLFSTSLFGAEIRRASEPVAGRYIVALPESTMNVNLVASDLAKAYDGKVLAVWKHAVKGFWVEISAENAGKLAKDRRVKAVEEDAVVHSSGSGTRDTSVLLDAKAGDYPLWHLQRISHRQHAVSGSETGYRWTNDGRVAGGSDDGKRAVVYVIDTGVVATHREFTDTSRPAGEGRVERGFSAAASPGTIPTDDSVAQDYVPPDTSPSDAPCRAWMERNPAQNILTDDDGPAHGTAVASMVTGKNVGVADGAVVVAVNVMSCGGGPAAADRTAAMLISGVDWVAGDVGNTSKLAVVSMSTFAQIETAGVSFCAATNCVEQPAVGVFEQAIRNLLALGVPVIASANNQNSDACTGTPARLSRRGGLIPSNEPSVITVGGTSSDDMRWVRPSSELPVRNPLIADRGSNYGQCVDIWAPAGRINVASVTPGIYRSAYYSSGTSYSAPIVAGLVARMLADDPSLAAPRVPGQPNETVNRVWNRLKVNATQIDPNVKKLGSGSPSLLAYLGGVQFTEQPRSQIVTLAANGQATVTLSVGVQAPTAALPLTYQWYRSAPGHADNAAKVGTGQTITFTCTGTACTGVPGSGDQYWVRVSRSDLPSHTADSTAARVTFGACALPIIDVQPASIWATGNATGTLNAHVSASPDTAWSYQWEKAIPEFDSGLPDDYTGHAGVDKGPFLPIENASGTKTGNTDVPPLPISQNEAVAYYRVVIRPTGSGCAAMNPNPSTTSDTAQVRICQLPTVGAFSITERDYDISSGNPALNSGLTAATAHATTYTWLFSATQNGTYKPLRMDYPDQTWETFRGAILYPPKAGYYKLRAENSCGFAVSPNSVHVKSTRDFELFVSISGILSTPIPANDFRLRTPIAVPCGTEVTLQIFPRTGGPARDQPFRRKLEIDWPEGFTPSQTAIERDTLVTHVYGKTPIVVKAYDVDNDPDKLDGRLLTVTLDVADAANAACRLACNTPSSTFELKGGQCVLTTDSAVYTHLIGGVVRIVPRVQNKADGTDIPSSDFTFTWVQIGPGDTRTLISDDAAQWQFTVGTAAQKYELIARRGEECDVLPIEIKPHASGATCNQCAYTCRRRSVRIDGALVDAITVPSGTDLALSPDAVEAGETYEWHRKPQGAPDDMFATANQTTVEPDKTTRYYFVAKNASNEAVVSDDALIAVEGSSSKPAVATPATQIVEAGAQVTLTAYILDESGNPVPRTPSMTYEWRRGSEYETSMPVIGTDAILSIQSPPDDVSYWCRIVKDGQIYDTNIANIVVTCTPTVFGTVLTQPPDRRVARGQSPRLEAHGTGKLLVYTWKRRLPNEPSGTGTHAGFGPVILPYLTAPVTHFSVTAEDACGTTGNLGEVAVYLCVPTIDTHPQSRTITPGEQFTLSVAATPAIDGQPLSVQWYRTSDLYRTNPLGTGTTFTTTLAAGVTSDSFYAAITSDCGGSPNTINSYSAIVDVCAYPTVTSDSVQSITGPGQHAVLAVTATGRGTLTYQWYQGTSGSATATLLAGETSHYLTVTPTTTTSYFCRVTADGTCSTNGPTITVPVCSNPAITTHPQSKTIFSGTSTTLTVAANAGTNTEPLTYAWWAKIGNAEWGPVAGATSATLTTPNLTTEARYVAVAKAGACYTSSQTAVISLCTYPEVVNAAPAETQTTVGEQVTLQLPTMSPVYDRIVRWYEGESGNRTVVAGGGYLNATITVSPTVTRKFWAEFEYGGCTSRTTTYTIRVCKPTITAQPTGTSVTAGTAVTLTVGTTALAGQTFQWYTGTPGTTTSPVAGATSASLTVTPPATTTYWVRVTGTCGVSADSAAATVTVCVPPSISAFTGPAVNIRAGESTVLAVTASGTDLSYQWYIGALGVTTNPVANSNWQNLTVSPSATTSYWVKVTSIGLCSTNTSRVVTVAVCNPPVFSTQPQSQKSFSGKAVTLTAAASSASGAVTYQWYTGTSGTTTSPISGATSASLTVSPTATTSYWVRATNAICTTNSATATITMCTYSEVVNASPADTQLEYGSSTTLSLPMMSPVYDKMVTWYRGASGDKTNPVAGPAINRTYTTPALTVTTQYWAEFSEGGCTSRTTTYTVSVCRPTITTQPQNVTIAYGQSTTVSVGTTPVAGQTYQWYIGAPGNTSSPVAGATSASLTVAPGATTSGWVRVTGTCGVSVDSAQLTITVCHPPAISSISPTQYIQYGSQAAINVTATGSNLSYQWYIGAPGVTTNPIASSNGATILAAPATTTTYWARVTSEGLCPTNSGAIVVDVCTTPSITTQPASKTIRTGTSTTLTVATSATGATYQWYVGAPGTTTSPIAGATSASVTVTPAADTQYWVRVTRGACSVNSSGATVTVCTINPTVVSVSSTSGQSVTLTANVTGARTTVYYSWYRGNSGDTTTLVNAGSGVNTLTVNPTSTTNYWVRVNDGTCTWDSATATVNVCIPTITAHPQSVVIGSGQSTTLSVAATGAPLTYQWYLGDSGITTNPIPGATSASYTTPALTSETRYWVKVSGCLATDSNTATVTVCIPPSISSTRFPGNNGSITITANGTNPAYQWYKGQSGDTTRPISGATSATYNFTLSTSEYYWVRVTACGTSVNSSAVMYSVAPTITAQPQNAAVPPNASATMSVTASGTFLSYQWYQGAAGVLTTPMSGATSSTFVTPPVTASKQYWVKVTSGTDGLAYSNAATASLCSGPQVLQFASQYQGFNSWVLSISIGQQDLGNVKYQWYIGTPGNVAQSTPYGDLGQTYYRSVYATASQTWWVRVWYNDNSCYTDTSGRTTYPVE